MRELPILFNAQMTRRVLDGTKTHTRREMSPQPIAPAMGERWTGAPMGRRCPYGEPGDRLWVREAWRTSPRFDDKPPRDLPDWAPLRYEADGALQGAWSGYGTGEQARLRPGMFMPRWASRITLAVTEIRAERLQDITEADAIAEGTEPSSGPVDGAHYCGYRTLWDQINGAGAWARNPWVWVVVFQRAVVRHQVIASAQVWQQ